MSDPDDIIGRDAIMKSIEARWAKNDHELFIAAVILNPFYQITPFRDRFEFNNAGIIGLFVRLWKRFNKTTEPPDPAFLLYAQQYLTQTKAFGNLLEMCQLEVARAAAEASTIRQITLESYLTNHSS